MNGATSSPSEVSEIDQRVLLNVAVEAVRAPFEGRPAHPVQGGSPALDQPCASFVTLREGPALLGCIGTIEPVEPLVADVAHNAARAAFADPRLPAVTPAQFAVMEVKVSVLSPLEELMVTDPGELAAVVVPGVDGLLLESHRHRGTFLPSVWEQLPSVDEFLTHLWRKAGLRPHTWPDDLRVLRYRTSEFADAGPRPAIHR
jgi:AmmeMemoRadiSam system protein A